MRCFSAFLEWHRISCGDHYKSQLLGTPHCAQLCDPCPAEHPCYVADLVARVCKGGHLRCSAVPGSKIAHGHTAMLVAMLRDVSSHVQELKQRHRQVMQNMLMDMLRALATPNMDIRKKTLDIALDLINQHNIDEVLPAAWQPCVSALLTLLACFTRALTARVHAA